MTSTPINYNQSMCRASKRAVGFNFHRFHNSIKCPSHCMVLPASIGDRFAQECLYRDSTSASQTNRRDHSCSSSSGSNSIGMVTSNAMRPIIIVVHVIYLFDQRIIHYILHVMLCVTAPLFVKLWPQGEDNAHAHAECKHHTHSIWC